MLSDEKKELFIKLWNIGIKEKDIAKILGIHANMVPVYARILGLHPRNTRAPPHKKITDEDLKLIKEMWLDGATIQEIADYFEVHPRTITQYLYAMGLKRRTVTRCPDIPKNKLKELAEKGLTDEEIARLFNTKRSCITRLRQKYGINKRAILRRRSKEKLNKVIETIVAILDKQGYTTSIELREKYGIRINRRILNAIEQCIEGAKWFKLTYTSTAKYTVFPVRFSNMTIIYLEGYEDHVIRFLKSNLIERGVPSTVLRILFKMNNAPQELIERVY